MSSTSYTFLNLLSETQAINAGFNLSERFNFTIYQSIKKLSTRASASSGQLYRSTTQIDSKAKLDEASVNRILKNLVSAKIIAQVICLEYKRIEGKDILKPVPVFFALSDSDENNPEKIFKSTIRSFIDVLDHYLNSIRPPDFEEIWSDLIQDLNRDEDYKFKFRSILNLSNLIQIKNFTIIPSIEMINATLEKIQIYLKESELIINIPGYGIAQAQKEICLLRYETAETFLVDKAIAAYLHLDGLQNKLEQIVQKEAIYYIDDGMARTTEFSAQKAKVLLEFIKKNQPAEKTTHPGELAIQTILSLSNKTNRYYRENWMAQVDQKIKDIIDPLFDRSLPWKSQILFITKDQENKIEKVVWDRIKNNPNLIIGEWENKETTMVIVLRRDKVFIKTLITEMIFLPPWEYWKILAIRQMIEDNDEYFSPLFQHKEFRRNYGKLLRLVYLKHIPFFYRFFMMIGIDFFQNQSFQIAKQKIQDRQNLLRIKNTERNFKNLRNQELIRLSKVEKIKNIGKINRIKDKLNQFYFIRKMIPGIREIQNSFGDLNIDDWPAFLKENGFQIIKSGSFEKQKTSILCFPKDNQWHTNWKKLSALLNEIIQSKPTVKPDDIDELTFQRAQRLQNYLSKMSHSRKINSTKNDAYIRLEKEIKKQKLKELKVDTLFDPDELDV